MTGKGLIDLVSCGDQDDTKSTKRIEKTQRLLRLNQGTWDEHYKRSMIRNNREAYLFRSQRFQTRVETGAMITGAFIIFKLLKKIIK